MGISTATLVDDSATVLEEASSCSTSAEAPPARRAAETAAVMALSLIVDATITREMLQKGERETDDVVGRGRMQMAKRKP